jgi:hypothetical protein
MSYQLYLDDECHECIHYVRPVYYMHSWTCIICGLLEEVYDDLIWACYELRCHHSAHSRCYKKWCKQEKTVGCPQCGLLSYTEPNQFCEDCDHFGHSFSNHT